MQDTTALPGLGHSTLARAAERSRWMALIVLCAGMLMIILDAMSVIINVSAQVSSSADTGSNAAPRSRRMG